jgi:Ca2+:H+ antiporter
VQRFRSEQPRLICTLLLLAVAALLVPSLAGYIHTPAAGHERALSVVASVVLLAVFVAGVPGSLRRAEVERADARAEPEGWPTWLAVVLLMTASALSGFVAAWFVDALTPAIRQLHISQAFAGLVIVAIAGNAVENAVGVTLAARNRVDYALSVVLNSPLQVALVLAPLLVLLSYVVGGVAFTLVFPPLLVAALAGSVLIVSFIIVDGESVWLEGAALVGLYVLVAASFWWG